MADELVVLPPLGGQFNASRLSNEELDPKVLLQLADMMTDRALRDQQLLPGPAKAQ